MVDAITTLDSKITHPTLALLLRNPSTSVLALILTYVIVITLTSPLYLLSFIVTGYSTTVLFLLALIYLIQSVGRFMTYPGASLSVQREISIDYLKRLSAQLLQICKQVSTLMSHLEMFLSQPAHHSNDYSLISKIAEIQSIPPYLFQLSQMIAFAIQKMKDTKAGGEYANYELFQLCVYQIAHHIQTLQCILQQNRIDPEHRELILACSKSAEELNDLIMGILPPKTDTDNYLHHFTHFVSSFIYGPQKFECLMFPLMQQQFLHVFQAELFSIQGNSQNTIHGAWIASRKAQPVGCLLFCCPNLGIVECIGLSNQETSWIGFYLSLGFNICVFNYRGYYNSTGKLRAVILINMASNIYIGSPSPDGIKSDVEVLIQYIRNHSPLKLLVHGESIGKSYVQTKQHEPYLGGLSASYAGRFCDVGMVVCDRTFCSLDAAGSRLLGTKIIHLTVIVIA